jgi:RNA methyltransferase, TrmH family
MIISSSSNPHLKAARLVREGRSETLLFVEGERLVQDLLASPLTIPTCFHLPDPPPPIATQLQTLQARGTQLFPTSAPALKSLSDTVSPQGIVALAHRPQLTSETFWQNLPHHPLLVLLDRIQDPGNLGTILRTAEAAGAHGIISLIGSTDPFSPKALRSAMGSAFRLPILGGLHPSAVIDLAQQHALQWVSAAGDGPTHYRSLDWTQGTLLTLGNEARGVAPLLLNACHQCVHIPIAPSVESLNVATAAAVLLFEAAHQRRLTPR